MHIPALMGGAIWRIQGIIAPNSLSVAITITNHAVPCVVHSVIMLLNFVQFSNQLVNTYISDCEVLPCELLCWSKSPESR